MLRNRLISLIPQLPQSCSLQQTAGFKLKLTKTPGYGYNTHLSNRAKEGLFHGKDVRFGHSISHSHTKSKRKWLPNVQDKRFWSESLNRYVKFKVTTTAIKAIDDYGGIDQYLLNLDRRIIQRSDKTSYVFENIVSILYHSGKLAPRYISEFGFDVCPPPQLQYQEFRPFTAEKVHPYVRSIGIPFKEFDKRNYIKDEDVLDA